MPHFRKRHVIDICNRLLKFSPIVGLFGHRQTGKTTFAVSLAAKYYSLDDEETLSQISQNPKKFCGKQKKFPCVIDECQNEPRLFPALKERIRKTKRPGQFFLTGSVRFTSRKAIRESLAGRLVGMELFPLVVSEILAKPLPDRLSSLLRSTEFQANAEGLRFNESNSRAFDKYLLRGGLPGLCFIREEILCAELLRAIHHLILDRDLRLLVNTQLSIETLMKFLRIIARETWQIYNASEVRRTIGLSPQTQKRLLLAFESIYLIRRIPVTGRSGEIILLEDQLEELLLSEGKLSREKQALSAFYRNCRAEFFYRLGNSTRFESYWTRDNARVPLVIRNEDGILGLIVMEGDQPSLSQKRSAASFLRAFRNAKLIFLSQSTQPAKVWDERMLTCPISSLL